MGGFGLKCRILGLGRGLLRLSHDLALSGLRVGAGRCLQLDTCQCLSHRRRTFRRIHRLRNGGCRLCLRLALHLHRGLLLLFRCPHRQLSEGLGFSCSLAFGSQRILSCLYLRRHGLKLLCVERLLLRLRCCVLRSSAGLSLLHLGHVCRLSQGDCHLCRQRADQNA